MDNPVATADPQSRTPHDALKEIASAARDLDNGDGPISSLMAMMNILNQPADAEAMENGIVGFSEAMFWLSCQGLDALKE
ncbi:MAG: hypothetical protein AAF484_10245, partial [Pseudomonadota bacterium]